MSNTFTQARYTEQSAAAFKGNPFIEALPPFRTSDEFLDILKNYPEVPEGYETRSKEERMQETWTALSFFQPLSIHADIAQVVDTVIRLGLVPRNLPDKDAYFWKDVSETKRLMAQNLALLPSPLTNGSSIIGASGMGKTTAITRIISQYPSVIEHPVERVGDAGRIQLVWLYLNCTTTKSIGALCGHFFKEIDRLFGLNSEEKGSHYWKYGRAQKVDALMDNVAHVAAMYRLGVLVIDELQFLSTVGVSMEQVMNYLTRLSNVAKVPIVYVGTYKVLKILMHEFRQARRSSGLRDFLWHPMELYKLDDKRQFLLNEEGNKIANPEWEHFVNALWNYQYLTAKTPLTPELSDALYDESQGITDFAVKLFLLAQVRAIATGKEKLSPALIRQVARDSIRLVAPFLKKLRDKLKDPNGVEHLGQLEDINRLEYEEFFEREARREVKLPSPTSKGATPKTEKPLESRKDEAAKPSKISERQSANSASQVNSFLDVWTKAKEEKVTCESMMLEEGIVKPATEFM